MSENIQEIELCIHQGQCRNEGEDVSGIMEGPLQPVQKIRLSLCSPRWSTVEQRSACKYMLEQLDAQRWLGPPGKPVLEQAPGRPMQSEAHT